MIFNCILAALGGLGGNHLYNTQCEVGPLPNIQFPVCPNHPIIVQVLRPSFPYSAMIIMYNCLLRDSVLYMCQVYCRAHSLV